MAEQAPTGAVHDHVGGPPTAGKVGAAALSIASNTVLILLKVVAGTLTGSVALLTEALHSSVDLIASIVAFVSIRKADEPADADHPYGHEKIENLAAAIEGMLILVGSGVIAFESIRRLVLGSEVEKLGFGIAVLAISLVANVIVSTRLHRRAAATQSPALHADAEHLRTDALTSAGVLAGLVLVQATGADWLDPAVALLVAASITLAGVRILRTASRVLVDEALPGDELEAIRAEVVAFGPHGVAGYHKLRARRAGARRYVDLHVQFRAGTTLEAAHAISHDLQDAIRRRLGDADVLIHLEPEDRVQPGTEIGTDEAPASTAPDPAPR
jgi:cation diffusion facilitator family transporter